MLTLISPPHPGLRRRWLLPLLVLTLLIGASAALPSPAHAAGRNWGSAAQTDTYSAGQGFGGGETLNSISCPSAILCLAVDDAGNAVSYNPSVATIPAPVNLIRETGGAMWVSCVSTSQCTAVSASAFEVTFDPNNLAAAPKPVQMSTTAGLGGVICVSTSLCVAPYGNQLMVFNPTAPANATVVSVNNADTIQDISCSSATLCSVVAKNGYVASFNPASPGTPNATTIAGQVTTTTGRDTISCFPNNPTPECVALNSDGNAFLINESSLSITNHGSIQTANVHSLTCQDATHCVAVTLTGQETPFNPSSVGTPSAAALDGSVALTDVLCASTSSCVALDAKGAVVSFTPSSAPSPMRTVIDPDTPTNSISCPSETQCTEIDNAGAEVTFNPTTTPITVTTHALVDPAPGALISCPTTTQCTTYDAAGYEATFNPQSPTSLSSDQINSSSNDQAEGISCPSATECVADSVFGWITFNPQSPGTPSLNQSFSDDLGVACPTTTQCTVMGNSGYEATFNPLNPPANPTGVLVDSNGSDQSISCPTVTQCTTVDTIGSQSTFNPQNAGAPTPQVIDTVSLNELNTTTHTVTAEPQAVDLTSVSCISASDCVVTDAQGNTLEGNPAGTTPWVTVAPAQTAGLTSVSCVDVEICVATDDSGFVSVGGLPAVSTAAPSISGTDTVGFTLTEAHGSWSETPAAYGYQWLDCDASGQNCTAISGATGQSYALTGNDLGHTIKVQESVTTAGGTGGPGTSAATAVVVQPTILPPPVKTTPKPTRTQILTELRAVLAGLKGANAKLATIVKRKGFVYTVKAPEAGKLTLQWTIKVRKRTEILATVTYRFTKAKTAKVTIKLTKAGLKLLENKKLKRETVTEKATFAGVTSTRAITLKR